MSRAELICPGSPLLDAVVDKVFTDHGHTLDRGAMLHDPEDPSGEPRLLVYLDHRVTDGRLVQGQRQTVSRRFHYVEIDRQGTVTDPGDEPYIGYGKLDEQDRVLLADGIDWEWADRTAEDTAQRWAIENLAAPHFDEIQKLTRSRVKKVREAVWDRISSEITFWDRTAEESKAKELQGEKPRIRSGTARQRADELEARLTRRRLELDLEEDLHNGRPTIVSAALVIPQGMLDALRGTPPDPEDVADKMETDRRGVEAVCEAERRLGRIPTPQPHSNPGFDIESVDPETGTHYFIEVKSHLPRTTEITVSATQVQKARSNADRWRLAIASVPDDPDAKPTVRYLVRPFDGVNMHFAQTGIPMRVADLLARAQEPI